MTKLSTTTLSQSYDSIHPSEDSEAEIQRFSSSVTRRGSRLSDIINLKERKKRNNDKRQRDKRGFTWRRWDPEGDFLHQRAPQPHISWQKPLEHACSPNGEEPQTPEETPTTSLQNISCSVKTVNNSSKSINRDPEMQQSQALLLSMDIDQYLASPSCSSTPPSTFTDLETVSNKSDNSFKTASSDPQINLLPAKITDSYNILPKKSAKAPHVNKNGSVVSKKLF